MQKAFLSSGKTHLPVCLFACVTPVLLAQADIRISAPLVFEPNVISGPANDGAPTFSPDGLTLFFGRSGASWGFIAESHKMTGHWSTPKIASFSGQWSDSQPAFSPDGTRILFESRRPLPTATGDAARKMQGSNLWESRRTATGWNEPTPLPDAINITANFWKPSVPGNGDVYFMTKTASDKTWRLYCSRFAAGVYEHAEPLPFSDGTHTDVDPKIAHDGSFLIFSSAGRAAAADTHEHLYITFQSGSGWGPIIPLRYEGDYEKNPSDDGEAQLSPDEKELFFTSSRTVPIHADRTRSQAAEDFERISTWDNSNNNVWSISLLPWLDQHRKETQP